jgi:hypothetical protein
MREPTLRLTTNLSKQKRLKIGKKGNLILIKNLVFFCWGDKILAANALIFFRR